jgi:hypothetical protein
MYKLTALLFALPFWAQSQTASYRIDKLADSSFYLVEVFYPAPTEQNQNPTPEEHPQKFNTKEQLAAYVAYLHKQADDARTQAKKLEDAAPRLEMAADKIGDLYKEMITASTKVVPQVVTPDKPKKEPKKKKRQGKN